MVTTTMASLHTLLDNNRRWAASVTARDPDFFRRLSRLQAPEFLWIGCSDSRVPANEIVDLAPGQLFVHRNVANIVYQTDLNMLSVLQFAIEVLGVKHVIVCGHYGCGGVQAAYRGEPLGLSDNWLRGIKDVYLLHREELESLPSEDARLKRLCELNVEAQAQNVARTTVVQQSWSAGHGIEVHAWVYGLENGILKDLGSSLTSPEHVPPIYRRTRD